ncbi:MAG: M28 family peptidase [Vicinamibacterales bacterium]
MLPVGAQAVRSSTHPAEEPLAAAVSSDRLRKDVRDLVALGPRMGGTPSGDLAAAHTDRLFREMGLGSRIERDPPLYAHWEEDWAVEIAPAGGRLESAWPYGFSPSASGSGELIVVKDLASATPDAAWAGRVIYTSGNVSRSYAAIAASPHRPLAILTSHPNDPKKYVDWSRIGSLPPGESHPVPVFALSYLDGRTAEVAAASHALARISLKSTMRRGQPATTIATLGGRDSRRYYLVTAHGDSDAGGPGADDNASGVATVLEIARALSSLVKDGRFRPAYSIRFVVWGTEYHSAKAYIEREGAKLADCLGVINLDETGTGAEREAIYFESNDVPWNAALLRTLERVGEDYVGKPGFWPEFTTNPSQGGTDSYAFLPKAYKGQDYTTLQIPATTVYTAASDSLAPLAQTPGWDPKGWPTPGRLVVDYSAYYHSSGDTPENTTEREPQNMVRAVKAVGIALLRLAHER